MSERNSFKYLYLIKHKKSERELCNLELRMLFTRNIENKVFFSDKKVNPEISPFINLRIDIIKEEKCFDDILNFVKLNKLGYSDFKVKYVTLTKDYPDYNERKSLCKKIGLHIIGYPDFNNPKIKLAITQYNDRWFLGVLNEDNGLWRNHNYKPYKYSASLNMNTAKALVNIATKGDFNKTIIDPCCGIGTVVLEALYAGYNIVGSDINYMVAKHANMNLKYYNYRQVISCKDIKDIQEKYDVAIVDMPYGLYYYSDLTTQNLILSSVKKIAKRSVIVNSADISSKIKEMGFHILDCCDVDKGMKRSNFKRTIWVCE